MAYPPITVLPEAPIRGDVPATFATKANAFVAALPTFRTDCNGLGSYLDGVKTACETAETNAELAETNAETAQGLAEDARDAAVIAKNAAEAAAGSMTPDSDTILMSTTPVTDSGTVPWTFVIKTLNGIGTYNLRSTPATHTTYQFKNSGTGTLTIGGNGHTIDGSATTTLESSASIWIRYDGTNWVIIDTAIGDAPANGSTFGRKDAQWVEMTGGGIGGITTELSASGTLVLSSVNAVVSTGDKTFVVPTGAAGSTIKIVRNNYGGFNVFTGAFVGGETALVISDATYSLTLSWLDSGNYWLYERN